jgi:uncharacterized protein (TIGR00369 family)
MVGFAASGRRDSRRIAGTVWVVRDRDELRRWFNSQDVVSHSYMYCDSIGEGSAVVRMNPPASLAAPNGAMNGGHLALLAENVGGLAVMSMYERDVWVGAIQMDVHFLAPVLSWPAVASARLARGGKRLAFVTIVISDAEGVTCAHGSSVSSLTTSVGWQCG